MKIHQIDNSLNNLGKAVLWQYDRAVRLLSVMKHMQILYHCAVEQFWQFWIEKVLAIDTCGALGCSVWGIFLGIPRPTVKGSDGKDRLIVTSVYRKILKGAFYLMKASSSFNDILGYLEIVFGVGGTENLSKWSVYVSEYGWTTNIDELNDVYRSGVTYSIGDIFSYDRMGDGILSNWKCTRQISAQENTSFDAIAEYVVPTTEQTNGTADDETLLLKLYDPEGICRKIGGAPNDSLSITVEYEFGETTIRAVATRRRKCGVTLIDNQDLSMEYGKSEYYEEMHRDQKLLFEQRLMEFCPFPLGIKTNEPVGRWVFGCAGQTSPMYSPGKGYSTGDIFGYVIENGKACNYKCIDVISSEENTSFEAISSKVEKTHDGGPLIDGLCEMTPPYADVRSFFSEYWAPSIKHISAPKEELVSIFPPKVMFVGYENGVYKIFKNTTPYYFFIFWYRETLDNIAGASNVRYFVSDSSTAETKCSSFAKAAREMGCKPIPYSVAITVQPDTTYLAGSTIMVNGRLRVVNSTMTTGQEIVLSDVLDATSPESNAGIHDWYPYRVSKGS